VADAQIEVVAHGARPRVSPLDQVFRLLQHPRLASGNKSVEATVDIGKVIAHLVTGITAAVVATQVVCASVR
jgi:hypothetical protein